MQRTQAPDNVAVLPARTDSETPGYATNGEPGVTAATVISADDWNMIQEELATIVTEVGALALSSADSGQAAEAIGTGVRGIKSGVSAVTHVSTRNTRAAVASDYVTASGDNSAVIASQGVESLTDCSATGDRSLVAASLTQRVEGDNSAAIASVLGHVTGTGCLQAACGDGSAATMTVGGYRNTMQASRASTGQTCAVAGAINAMAACQDCNLDGVGATCEASISSDNGGTYSSLSATNQCEITDAAHYSRVDSSDTCTVSADETSVSASTGATIGGANSGADSTDTATITGTFCRAIASDTATIQGERAVDLAGSDNSLSAAAIDSACIASNDCTVAAENAVVMASSAGCQVGDNQSAVIACGGTTGCTIDGGVKNGILAGDNCDVSGQVSACVAAYECDNAGYRCIMAASDDCSVTDKYRVAILGSYGIDVTANQSGAIASQEVSISGAGALSAASSFGELTGVNSSLISSQYSKATAECAVTIASFETINDTSFSLAGGYAVDVDPTLAEASTDHKTWKLSSMTGAARLEGDYTTGAADYAEMFENEFYGIVPVGTFVTRHGRKVRLAQPGDRVLGIVSVSPGVVGNESPFCWSGAFHRDEWGRKITTKKTVMRKVRNVETGNETEEPHTLHDVPRSTPEWDRTRSYIPRRERPAEWTCVGLLGQIRARVGEGVAVDDFIVPGRDGIGIASHAESRLEVMEILHPYTPERGYAIAMILVR